MFNEKKAREILVDILKKTGEPSISVSVYDNGKIYYITEGYRDVQNKINANEDTLYSIGSCTKAFVAAALAILADDGKISFDDKVRKFVPEFEMVDKYIENDITIRDILSHRTGLCRHDYMWYPHLNESTAFGLIKKMKYLQINKPLRYTYQYQNMMYVLAGYIVERVSGQSWEDFVTERIFKPIGMEPVKFNAVEDLKQYKNSAIGYSCNPDTKEQIEMPYKNLKVVGAAGCINTSSAQMIKWVELNLNSGLYNNKRIISYDNLSQCHKPQMLVHSDEIPGLDVPEYKLFSFSSYGFGWDLTCYRGRKLVYHGGNIDGFTAMTAFMPNTGFGISILTNCNEGISNSIALYSLIDLYFEDEYIDWYGVEKSVTERILELMKARTVNDDVKNMTKMPYSFDLKSAVGKYSNPAYGEIIITLNKENEIHYKFGDYEGVLEHAGYDFFAMKFPAIGINIVYEFRVDFNGNVVSLESDLEPEIDDNIVFRKID